VSGLLEGKVCHHHRCGRGIGRDMALVFVREGARVVLAGGTTRHARGNRAPGKAAGGESLCVVTNVARSEDCRSLVEATVRKYSRLDAP